MIVGSSRPAWRWAAEVAPAVAVAALLLVGLPGCGPADDDISSAIDLQDRLSDIELDRGDDGLYVVLPHNGETHRLTAGEYLIALQDSRDRQRDRGWIFELFNITSWYGVAWVALGLGGQVLFTGRMVIQWLASERERRSVVPPVFWWMSLIGASMLLAYFFWRKDIVGVLGQGSGWLIYARNIWMIHRPAFTPATPATAPQRG